MKCKLCEKGDALGVTKCSYAFMIGLFCRERFNDKWDIWGNEVDNDIDLRIRDDNG